jgi:tryptophanyl-tRNA synthetase
VDVDLLLQDEVQEQLERPLEDGRVDRVRHRREVNCRRPRNRGKYRGGVPRVLSCIQPTGDVHLGNYLGALRPWVEGQHEAEVFHGIVDLHALTVTDRPGVLGDATLRLAAMLFAVGLDPRVATVFVQSHLPEHSQLAWVMECTVSFGELSRMTQFKDKAAKREGDFVSAGLFTYPALQAADILLYDADEVPVGEDQRQHVEITRDVAQRFNHRFGDTFVVPRAVTPRAGARVMDLGDPTSKMSKSGDAAGCVMLLDDPATVTRKFMRAVTDSDSEIRHDREAKPGVSNLLEILAAASGTTPEAAAGGLRGYGDLKSRTAEAVVAMLAPVQARYRELVDDRAELARLVRLGDERARAVASATLARAYAAIGLLPG